MVSEERKKKDEEDLQKSLEMFTHHNTKEEMGAVQIVYKAIFQNQ